MRVHERNNKESQYKTSDWLKNSSCFSRTTPPRPGLSRSNADIVCVDTTWSMMRCAKRPLSSLSVRMSLIRDRYASHLPRWDGGNALKRVICTRIQCNRGANCWKPENFERFSSDASHSIGHASCMYTCVIRHLQLHSGTYKQNKKETRNRRNRNDTKTHTHTHTRKRIRNRDRVEASNSPIHCSNALNIIPQSHAPIVAISSKISASFSGGISSFASQSHAPFPSDTPSAILSLSLSLCLPHLARPDARGQKKYPYIFIYCFLLLIFDI